MVCACDRKRERMMNGSPGNESRVLFYSMCIEAPPVTVQMNGGPSLCPVLANESCCFLSCAPRMFQRHPHCNPHVTPSLQLGTPLSPLGKRARCIRARVKSWDFFAETGQAAEKKFLSEQRCRDGKFVSFGLRFPASPWLVWPRWLGIWENRSRKR